MTEDQIIAVVILDRGHYRSQVRIWFLVTTGETSVRSYRLSESDESEIRPLARGDLRPGRRSFKSESLISADYESGLVFLSRCFLFLHEVKLTIQSATLIIELQ